MWGTRAQSYPALHNDMSLLFGMCRNNVSFSGAGPHQPAAIQGSAAARISETLTTEAIVETRMALEVRSA